MRAIGGYFGLDSRGESMFHDGASGFNSARNALGWLLKRRGYSRVYMPAYCCGSLLEALEYSATPVRTYCVDARFELVGSLPELKEGEAILYVNYYGLKRGYVEELYGVYGDRLIVDNSQAFFDMPVAPDCATFYSPRKFFGVADGGLLYAADVDADCLERDVSAARVGHLAIRVDESAEAGFDLYRESEAMLGCRPVRRMSRLTESLLRNIDYEGMGRRRRDNFAMLSEELQSENLLTLDYVDDDAIPMVYPLLVEDGSLREMLIRNRIYTAKYWPHTMGEAPAGSEEAMLRKYIVTLPIDHRYGQEEMLYISKTVKSLICK